MAEVAVMLAQGVRLSVVVAVSNLVVDHAISLPHPVSLVQLQFFLIPLVPLASKITKHAALQHVDNVVELDAIHKQEVLSAVVIVKLPQMADHVITFHPHVTLRSLLFVVATVNVAMGY